MPQLVERYAKIPRRQRYLVVAALPVLLVIGYYYGFYGDLSAKREQLERQYRSLESERAEKQAYADNLVKYEARLAELQQNLNAARAQLPDAADVPQLLAQLGNKGRQSGLIIERFEPKGETIKDFYAEIAIAVKVRGAYNEVATFIDSIGKLDRIVNVSDISMVNPKTENQKVVIDGSFVIKTFRFIDVAEKAKADEAKGKGAKK